MSNQDNQQFCVWYIHNAPGEAIYIPVKDVAQATFVINAFSKAMLDLENIGSIPEIDSNVFGLETLEDGEWVEWVDEDGRTIDEVMDEVIDEDNAQ